MENKYYVYLFLNSLKQGNYQYHDLIFDHEPFYVGKGTKDRMKESLRTKNSYKANMIKYITNNGGKVIIIKLYNNLTENDSFELEIETIKKIGRKDLGLGPLTNLTDGGEGPSPSEETRLKISETQKNSPRRQELIENLRIKNLGDKNPMFGKTHTDEVKETHSLLVSGTNHPMYGMTHSAETIQKIRETRAAGVDQAKASEESRLRNNRSVLQYDLNDNFIQEFESIKVAAKTLNLTESLIGKLCRGEVKTAKIFKFVFKDINKEMFNSFKYKIGDTVDNFILIKRCNRSVIAENENKEIKTLRKREYPQFWQKNKITNEYI